ncbi:hypothetical protein EON73_01230 [bacterium]|nr:MAG: hypothetical protein EON73_01230 [bacterium]
MNNPVELGFSLSKVDRSVADNLKDIDKSYEGDAQTVLDFIMFITQKLNNNLFGYTRFTIKEYSDFTGITPSNLCAIHPDIANGRRKAPFIEGHKFESILDYTLYRMLSTNIVFSKVHEYREDGHIIQLENYPILKDVYLQSGSVMGPRKIYEVRLSDAMMEGFVKKYYTIDTTRLPAIGKGKGGHSRKKVYIWLNKIFHMYSSKQEAANNTIYSVDFLADLAGVMYMKEPDKKGNPVQKEPKHKKESVSNVLKSIQRTIASETKKLHFSFEYQFVNGSSNKYDEDYFVKFDFTSNLQPQVVKQMQIDHKLKYSLLKDLRSCFDSLYPKQRLAELPNLEDETDPFQRWLNNPKRDTEKKVNILKSVYLKAHDWDKSKQLKDNEALKMIYEGFLKIEPAVEVL